MSPPLEQEGRVEELVAAAPGCPQDHGRPAVRRLLGEILDRTLDRVRKSGLQDQIFGRIAGDDELGRDHEIGALLRRRGARAAEGRDVASDVADRRVELRQGDREDVGHGPRAAQAAAAKVTTTRWQREGKSWRCVAGRIARNGLEATYQAMLLGVRDYVTKNGFPGVLIGLSGGINSALTAVAAADALGPDKVHCLRLPSRITSRESMEDAAELARLVGLRLDTVSIAPAVEAFDAMLTPALGAHPKNVTAENIQPRARAMVLMALSNATGNMLLTTGNKSEMSVGYATLYGDMCGGYNALKDIYKTTVYALSRWRNEVIRGRTRPRGRVIPSASVRKAPTAELKPDQTDEDTLRPYETPRRHPQC